MAKEVVLKFLGDAKQLNATFAAVEAQASRSMAGLQASVATAGGGVTSKLGAVATTVAAAGATLRGVGKTMSRNVTLPLALMGGGAIKLAVDYERSMNVLQAASGATGAQMSAFGRLAQQLGGDVKLPGTSAADAAEAMLELSKAGLTVTDTMGAARGVLQLSAAGGLSNAEAATVAANALNAFRLEGSQASRVADLLAGAANGSSAEVSDLAQSLSQGASVFAQAGIPIEDFVSSAALLANVGIKGSDAGTSLKTMLQRLQNPTGEAAEMMRKLGVDVYDAQGQMRPFRSLIAQFSGATARMSQEQRDAAMSTIFGSDAIRGANAVLLAGAPAFDKMMAATTEQGAAAKMAGARNKGLGGALDGLKSAMETFALKVLVPALPVMTNFINALSNFIPKIARLPKPVLVAAAAFGGILAAIGPLSFVFGALLHPIGLLAGALAVVGVAVWAALNPDKAGVLFEKFQAKWAELAPGIIARLGTVRTAVGNWITTNGPVILAQLAEWGRAFINWISPFIPPLLEKLGHFLGAIGTWILDVALPWLGEKLRNWIPAFTDWLAEVIPPLMTKLGELLGKIGGWVLTEALPKLLASFWNLGTNIASGLIEGILSALRAGLTGALNFLIDTVNRALSLIDTAAGPMINFGEIPQISLEGAPAAPRSVQERVAASEEAQERARAAKAQAWFAAQPPARSAEEMRQRELTAQRMAMAQPAQGGNAGRMIPMARGGLLLGLNRPTPILAGEGRGREDVLAVPHSKGGIGGMGGVNPQYHFHGRDHPIASDIEAANRHLGWKLALAGRR